MSTHENSNSPQWDDSTPPKVASSSTGPWGDPLGLPVVNDEATTAAGDGSDTAVPVQLSGSADGDNNVVTPPDISQPINWDDDSSEAVSASASSRDTPPSTPLDRNPPIDWDGKSLGGTSADPTPSYVSATDHGYSRRPRLRKVVAAQVAGLVVLGALAGTTGYLLGHHNGTGSSGSSSSPFSGGFGRFFGGSSGASGATGNFGFGGFGNFNGSASQPSVTNVPTAIRHAEAALVDINTTVDFGTSAAAGTGIVLTSNGLILTNNHVIDGATSLSVVDIGNGQTYGAHVVGYDAKDDVALIQLSGASGLATASIASRAAAVGDSVYTVGNAGGVGGSPTVTTGKVTALNQSITASDASAGTSEALTGMIGTNSPLYSGDSGGAMMTPSGDVVGMDTAAASTVSISSSTQGFAIPIAKALSIAQQIRQGAASNRVHIGTTAFLGVEITATSSGASVVGVNSGSPAAGAGITAGSVITGVGSTTITSASALQSAVGKYHPGTKVVVTWTDASGVSHHASVTLASGPAQ